MPQVHITLPPDLTVRHQRVALKYFEKTDRLSVQEWRLVLETFDVLGKGTVAIGRQRMSFRQAYDRFVDRRYADHFLATLMALEHLHTQMEALLQESARAMLTMLEREGLYHEEVVGSEYLAAYCLYWWTAFMRGYCFELIIFRDLHASGIAFVAHDLGKRTERRSPYDLVVLRQLGDIKSTTYFLYTTRTLPLNCDFYITRLYDPRQRRYMWIVVMTETAWRTLNGDVGMASLETAAEVLPKPVHIVFAGHHFVIVPFELWKEKVKQRQQEER